MSDTQRLEVGDAGEPDRLVLGVALWKGWIFWLSGPFFLALGLLDPLTGGGALLTLLGASQFVFLAVAKFRAGVVLDRDGFEVQRVIGRKRRYAWSEVDNFRKDSVESRGIPFGWYVAFDIKRNAPHRGSVSEGGGLPMMLEIGPDDLAERMGRMRDRALAEATSQHREQIRDS